MQYDWPDTVPVCYTQNMKSSFYHVQLNIDFSNLTFYKELFSFLGWSIIFEVNDVIGYNSKKDGDLWFVKNTSGKRQDYDAIGVNHLSIRVEFQQDIDAIATYLRKKHIQHLFETPRHRPEFSSEGNTYYQVMFTSPDNILFEIVYIGPKEFVSK